jgi:hypothetical protein
MLKKETMDAAKKLVECSVILIIAPLAIVWDKFVMKLGFDYSSLLRGGFIATLAIYAIYSGATVFLSEKKDGAWEYLFSLPVARWQILVSKTLPRLGFLLMLCLPLAAYTGFSFIRESGIIFVVLFFSSLFLSIAIDYVVLNIVGVLILFSVYNQIKAIFVHLISRSGQNYPPQAVLIAAQLVAAFIFLLPFAIAFWLTFKKMDLKPLRLQLRLYYSITLPAVIVLIAAIIFSHNLHAS